MKKQKQPHRIVAFLTWLELQTKKAEKCFECKFFDTKNIAADVKFLNTSFIN